MENHSVQMKSASTGRPGAHTTGSTHATESERKNISLTTAGDRKKI